MRFLVYNHIPMQSAVAGFLNVPRPGHGRSDTSANEDRQPEASPPNCEPQTSKQCSPEDKSPSDSPTRPNGNWFAPNAPSRSSLVLKNSGNIARDHLSIERTWLAYMRTGLSITWIGMAIVQCFALITSESRDSLQTEATRSFGLNATSLRFTRPLCATLALLSLCVIAIGLRRYFKVQKAIMQGLFPAPQIMVVLLSTALATLVVVTLGVLLTVS